MERPGSQFTTPTSPLPENEKVQLKISFTVGKISGTLGVIIQV
jgi:hypothetical protein